MNVYSVMGREAEGVDSSVRCWLVDGEGGADAVHRFVAYLQGREELGDAEYWDIYDCKPVTQESFAILCGKVMGANEDGEFRDPFVDAPCPDGDSTFPNGMEYVIREVVCPKDFDGCIDLGTKGGVLEIFMVKY